MKLKVHSQILIAIVLGVVVGLLLGKEAAHIKIVGDIFIRLLKMIIIPLILASMVAGIVSLGDVRKLGRIGLRTFLYYTATTLLAVLVGLILVNVIRPGARVDIGDEEVAERVEREANLFAAMAQDKVLSIIFFAIILGVAISSVGEKARGVAALFESFNAVMMKITGWIMRLAPFGVFALMAYTIGSMGLSVIKPLILYMATVIVGLSIHAIVTLPMLLSVFGRYSPLKFIKDVFSAVATAFSTASSAATLPITMDCVEKNAGVSNKVASFVLPLGATVNMDGTA
ncbi:MAG: dicarboxylate/amino acid:cation symporter, partial [Planctomycetota bacterium]